MNILLHRLLARTIKKGRLEIIDAAGAAHRFGDGKGIALRVRFNTASAERALLLDPEMKLGEEYMNGGYDIEFGTVADFLTLLLANAGDRRRTWWTSAIASARFIVRRLAENNGQSQPAHRRT